MKIKEFWRATAPVIVLTIVVSCACFVMGALLPGACGTLHKNKADCTTYAFVDDEWVCTRACVKKEVVERLWTCVADAPFVQEKHND